MHRWPPYVQYLITILFESILGEHPLFQCHGLFPKSGRLWILPTFVELVRQKPLFPEPAITIADEHCYVISREDKNKRDEFLKVTFV